MIYIVDDDANVRRAFTTLLLSAGYKSEACCSVIEFLKECQPTESDLLILDMHMADVDGSDLLMDFGKRRFHMPIIVATAYDTPQARDYARNYGVVAFLRKPVDGDALIDMVKFSYTL